MRHDWVASLLFGSLLVVGSAARAVEAPDLRLLEKRGEAFVAAMNAPGDAPLVDFAKEHLESRVYAKDQARLFVETMNRHRLDFGAFDRHLVQVLPGGRAVFAFVRSSKKGAWWNFQFRVAEGSRLQLFFLAEAVEPIPRPTTPIESPETRAWLDRFVASMEELQPFSGVVLIEKGGKEIYSLARGVERIDNSGARQAITRGSRLGLASGSKMFTAVAILQLIDAGKFSLDTTLLEILPAFPNRDYAAKVTVRQLLQHTAGAGNYWDDAYEKEWGAITETGQMMPHVLRHLGEKPIGEYSYSNSGYLLLGAIVEAVSGKSFYDYVKERIFVPAGMKATGYPLRSKAEPGVAEAYRPEYEAGAIKPGSYLVAPLGERGTAAGGAASTVDDLVAFLRALSGGKLLKPETWRAMIAPQVPMGPDDPTFYGYGTIVKTAGGRLSYGHGGTAPGTFFDLEVYPELELVTIVISNYDTVGGYELARAIADIVRRPAASP